MHKRVLKNQHMSHCWRHVQSAHIWVCSLPFTLLSLNSVRSFYSVCSASPISTGLIVASYSTWHQPRHASRDKSVQAFPRFLYCKRQKLGVEVWEWGYQLGPVGSTACTHATQAHHLLTVEHMIHPMYVYIRQVSLHCYRHTYCGRKSFNDVTDSEGTACLVHLHKGKKYEWKMSAYVHVILEQASRI